MKKLTIKQVREEFEKNQYYVVDKNYVNNYTKINVLCPNGHKWHVAFTNFVQQGQRCPACLGVGKKTFSEVKKNIELKGYTLLNTEYKNNRQKLETICPNGHGHVADYHGFMVGHGCKECAGNKRLTLEQIQKVFEKKGFFLLDQPYVNANTKLRVICPLGREYSVTYTNFKYNTGGCPTCKPDKIKDTCNKKYGVNNPSQIKGVREKINETCLNRYGTIYVAQNHDIALKAAKSLNNMLIKTHWKTGEELICVGSYEARTVDYFNKNEINFEWQPKTFKMPRGKTYRPDLYLSDTDIWVEIKGYMRKDAQEKWDWFKSEHPTAELWDKKKLKEMGIL